MRTLPGNIIEIPTVNGKDWLPKDTKYSKILISTQLASKPITDPNIDAEGDGRYIGIKV